MFSGANFGVSVPNVWCLVIWTKPAAASGCLNHTGCHRTGDLTNTVVSSGLSSNALLIIAASNSRIWIRSLKRCHLTPWRSTLTRWRAPLTSNTQPRSDPHGRRCGAEASSPWKPPQGVEHPPPPPPPAPAAPPPRHHGPRRREGTASFNKFRQSLIHGVEATTPSAHSPRGRRRRRRVTGPAAAEEEEEQEAEETARPRRRRYGSRNQSTPRECQP
jgi:hypothetical protein